MLKLPAVDASFTELQAHYRIVGTRFAEVPYVIALHLCQTCLKDGENVLGKEGNPGQRNRYCSEECQALAKRLSALRPQQERGDETNAGSRTLSGKGQRRRGRQKGVSEAKSGSDSVGGSGEDSIQDRAGSRERDEVPETRARVDDE